MQTKEMFDNTKLMDLTGQRFGLLTVLNRDENSPSRYIKWHCLCDCGNETYVTGINLRTGNTMSCGCLRNNFEDLSGRVFGDLTVLSRNYDRKQKVYYDCVCSCGKKIIARSDALKSGRSHSCGCSVVSNGISKIRNLLDSEGIEYRTEVCFKDLISQRGAPLRFDIAIMNGNEITMLIEFDGRQHYRAVSDWWGGKDGLEYRKKCDRQKDKYAIDRGIPLSRIPYTAEGSLCIDDIIGGKYIINKA